MSAATSQALPDFYTWGFANSPVQVHLYLEVVSRIRKQIQDSEDEPGVFSGWGLLSGDLPKPGITRVLDCQPLPTLDAASVVAASGARGQVVGFYRTAPVGSIAMLDEDKALAASLFSHPSSVFLLVETGKSGIGNARFCFWGEGELFDWPLMPFPFEPVELAVEERRRRSKPQVTPLPEEKLNVVSEPAASGIFPVSPADDRQKSSALPPAKRPRPAISRRWLLLALLALVAVSVPLGGLWYFRRGADLPAAPQPAADRAEAKSTLGLAAERRGNDLVVSWNGNAPAISQANFGMLLIRGTKESRDIPLTTDELRSGRVVYAAPEDQVRFQLNVVAGEQVTRESLTFVLPRASENRTSPTSAPRINSNAVQPPPPQIPAGSTPVRELRQFKPVEKRDSAPASTQRIEEPPAVVGAAPVANGSLPVLGQAPVSLPAPVQAPGRATSTPTTPPQAEPPLLSAQAHPPVATRQLLPPVPPLLRGKLYNATVVEVNVSVDVSGNVVKAEAVAKPGLHPMLRDAAVQAAQRWKFQPAQFNGHAVPASIVLQFNFAASR